MKRLLTMVFCIALAGCAGTVKYVSDGKVHQGTFNKVGKSMTATIDGRLYRGNYVLGQTSSFGTGFASSGGATASGFGTRTTTNNNARATLLSDDGKILRCEFVAGFMEASGLCTDSDGRQYDMLAG